MTAPLVGTEAGSDGWVRLTLDAPPANILTVAMCGAVREALARAQALPGTKLVSIEGAGRHFSYGASVHEHLPTHVSEMLPALHAVIADLLDAQVPTAAIVRGRCLGGGLEVALACDLVFASAEATLGVPEIALGVFPPAAAALLPLKIGAARASRVVLTGEALAAEWWEAAGLVRETASAEDLDDRVGAFFEAHLAPRSSVALAHAARAARTVLREQSLPAIARLERQYLDDLMRAADPVEGCTAFVEKRAPRWRNS